MTNWSSPSDHFACPGKKVRKHPAVGMYNIITSKAVTFITTLLTKFIKLRYAWVYHKLWIDGIDVSQPAGPSSKFHLCCKAFVVYMVDMQCAAAAMLSLQIKRASEGSCVF